MPRLRVSVRMIQQAKTPQLIALHGQGYSSAGLAKALDIPLSTVGRLLKRSGLKKHSTSIAGEKGYKISPEAQDDIVKAYADSRSKRAVHLAFGLSYPTIEMVLDIKGVDHRDLGSCADRITEKQADEIISSYQSGTSQNEICRQYGLYPDCFAELMAKRAVEVRGQLKHDVDSSYFGSIDTFYKAYFLGLLAADGSISYTRDSVRNRGDESKLGRISISLQERDSYLLDRFKDDIGFSGTITLVDKGPGRQHQRRLAFCDQKMAQSLYRLGLTDNKSFSLGFPEIPTRFVAAFILGYFDGDGTICESTTHERGYPYTRQYFSVICAKPFAETLSRVLNEKGIDTHLGHKKCQGGIMYSVRTSSRDGIEKVYRLLYHNAPFYLRRKHDKFVSILTRLGVAL